MRWITGMLVLSVIASCNRQVQPAQQQQTGTEKKVASSDIIYPDPWRLTFKVNHVQSAVAYQYDIRPGKKDSVVIKDSIVYDEEGRQILQSNDVLQKRNSYNDHGFMQMLGIYYGKENKMRYFITYQDDPKQMAFIQKSYLLKDARWDAPANTTDTLHSFPASLLKYDSQGHIMKEIGVDANTTYFYDDNGYVTQVVDSNRRLMMTKKQPMTYSMSHRSNGSLTAYVDMIGSTLNERGIFNSKGLLDSMKMYTPDGRLSTYRTFKYYYYKK